MTEVVDVPPSPPPPPPPPVIPAPSGPQFDFGKPFAYVFEDPDWAQKVLIGGLFNLAGVVIIGWFFIFGYVAQLVRNIISEKPRPLPEWDNLGNYFNEGLRIFGVGFVYMLPIISLAFLIMVPAVVMDAIDSDALNAIGGIFTGCMSLLLVPLVFAVIFFLPAALLFVTVEQRFGAAFELKRIWPFIKQNIGNYLLAIVVWLIARFLGGLGWVLLCIGVFFTAFWSLLVTAHAFAQVYRLAVQRKE